MKLWTVFNTDRLPIWHLSTKKLLGNVIATVPIFVRISCYGTPRKLICHSQHFTCKLGAICTEPDSIDCRVRFPHVTKICLIYKQLFRMAVVSMSSIVCKRTKDTVEVPSVAKLKKNTPTLTLKSESEAIRSSSSLVALEAWWWWRTAGACIWGGCCCDCAGSTTVSWTVTVTCLVPGRGRVPPWEGGGTGDVEARLRTIER